jgi:arylsulfatase A-like enzyme
MKIHLRHLFIIGLAFCLMPACSFAMAQQPNILVILVDDLGYADVSYYTDDNESEYLETPNIDALAHKGMRFSNFYANSTVCSPTRAALLTGLYPGMVGMPGVVRTKPETSWGYLSPTVTTLADRLLSTGYYTGLVGKWHLGFESPNLPNDRGFRYFKGFLGDMMDDYWTHLRHGENYMRENKRILQPHEHTGRHATELFSDWAIQFIQDQASSDQPFFLYLAYNAPHYPIEPPDSWPRHPELDAARAELVALIEHMDYHIGRVMDALDAANVKNNTLVIFASDNGGQYDEIIRNNNYKRYTRANNGPFRGSKGSLYEGGTRVPMVAVWPDVIEPGGRQSDAVALVMDLFPTILDAAGSEIPEDIDGLSLLPVLRDEGHPPLERLLFWQRRDGWGKGAHHAVRFGQWKLVQPFTSSDPFELYNIIDDPYEENDLSSEFPYKYVELKGYIDDYIAKESLVPYRQSQPAGNQAFTVNETIEAEQFDIYCTAEPTGEEDTGEGSAYHDNEPQNLLDGNFRPGEGVDINQSDMASNGFNVGSARAGEWLTYTINIPVSGIYKLVTRVALPGEGGTFHAEIDNEDKTGPMVIPNTGGWQNWVEIKSNEFTLTWGTQQMRIMLDANKDGGNFVGNFDWFKIIPVNIALNKPAFSSSVEFDDPALEPQFAVDGDSATRWSSDFSDPQWIMLDLGSQYEITRVVLNWEVAYGSDYEIQLSDDKITWRTIHSEESGNGGIEDITTDGVGRYLRIWGERRGTIWGYSLWEIEVYGLPLDNIALNKPAFSSSVEFDDPTLEPQFAVDGDPATRWSSSFSDPQWIMLDLGRQYGISRVVLNWEMAYGSDYEIQLSDDKITWRTIHSEESGNGGIEDIATTGVGRYLRIWGDLRGTIWGYSLWELEAYGTPAPKKDLAETMEFGEVQINHNWTQVYFDHAFDKPVVVAGPLSYNGDDPSMVRIRNIDPTGFEIRIQEWDYLDDIHTTESVGYLVIEEGSYTLDDGTMVQAATTMTGTGADFRTITFDEPFTTVPVVMTTIASFNDPVPVTGRIKDVSNHDFQFRMQEEEASATIHGIEMLSYIAWEPSDGTLRGIDYLIKKTADIVDNSSHTIFFDESFASMPTFLADMQTFNGKDTANLRYSDKTVSSVDVFVTEETSKNAETDHVTEAVGYMVFSE